MFSKAIVKLLESAYEFVSYGGIVGLWLREWEGSVIARRVIGGIFLSVPLIFVIVCLVAIGYFNFSR